MDNADFPVVLFSVFVLKQRRWWWLHLRCSKMLKPKFLKEKLSFWRWTNVDREVAACWTGWEGERRREVTPWQRQSGTGLSCAGVHLMCIDKGSKGPRLNRPGIISPGIRAPWQAAYTASFSSTSPTTLVSTCLGTSTCHRGGGLSRGQMSLQCEQHFTIYRCQEDPNFQKYIKGSKAMLPQVNREKIALFFV